MESKPVTENFRIEAPHFQAGGWFSDGVVEGSAPVLHYLRGWTRKEVVSYVITQGWIIKTDAHSLA